MAMMTSHAAHGVAKTSLEQTGPQGGSRGVVFPDVGPSYRQNPCCDDGTAPRHGKNGVTAVIMS